MLPEEEIVALKAQSQQYLNQLKNQQIDMQVFDKNLLNVIKEKLMLDKEIILLNEKIENLENELKMANDKIAEFNNMQCNVQQDDLIICDNNGENCH